MNHVSESLDWSFFSIFGAILGYLLHIFMSWGEWRKLSKQPDLTLRCFLMSDPPAQVIGFIVVIAVYCSLSVLSQWDVMRDMLGFVPKVDFFGAFMTAFTSQGLAIKLRNMRRKLLTDDGNDKP